jgi:forkhead transcription factor HCM1
VGVFFSATLWPVERVMIDFDLSPVILAPSSADTEQFPLYGIPPGLRAATKPPHSYAEMIFQALYSHPHRRLSLAALYAWVSAAYPFYRPGDPGWMNSIRHNLSLTPEFQKRERPGDEPGKGNLWHLVEVTEGSVLPGKKR